MNCLCGCVEKNDGEKRKDNKRIRLVTYLCDIMEVESESDYETVEVTYIEASAMSNCGEGIYLFLTVTPILFWRVYYALD